MFDIVENAVTPQSSIPRSPAYPFKKLGVGEAFDVLDDMGWNERRKKSVRQLSVRASAYAYSYRTADRPRFSVGEAPDREGYIRCKRIA